MSTPVRSKKIVKNVSSRLFSGITQIVLAGLVLMGTACNDKATGSGGDDGGQSLVTVANLEDFMVPVEGGTFTIGCRDGVDADVPGANCLPAKDTTVATFYICKYEVTQGLWKEVMRGSNPSLHKGVDLPVDNIKWGEAQSFVDSLNKRKPGYAYRLVKEAEWEYAARGGAGAAEAKYSGSDDVNSVAWHSDNSGLAPHKVGTKTPNGLGIHDMSGNVWEWLERGGDAMERFYIERGGSWGGPARYGSVTYRNQIKRDTIGGVPVPPVDNIAHDRGFRIARNPAP